MVDDYRDSASLLHSKLVIQHESKNMDQELSKYGGREFLRYDLPIVRRLAWGEILTVMPYGGVVGGGNRDTLLRLVNAGYAEECTTKWHQKFRATPELYELKAIEDARTPVTFDELAVIMGRSLDKAACRKWRQKMRSHAKTPHVFPTIRDVQETQDQVRRDPDYIEEWPIEEGDVYQFSSRRLTDWYVQRFCAANNLTQQEP